MRDLRAASRRKLRETWAESIITSAKRNVKFEGVDEKPEDVFSQNSTGALGGEYHHFGKKNCKI